MSDSFEIFVKLWPMFTFFIISVIGLIAGWIRFEMKQKEHDAKLCAMGDNLNGLFEARDKITKIETTLVHIQSDMKELKELVINYILKSKEK